MLACRFEGMAAHAGEVVPLSPRLSCSDCSDCGVLLPCMCRNVCVCACVCNASRRHLPTRTQRRSPMRCLPSVLCVAGDHWHQSRATASQPSPASLMCHGGVAVHRAAPAHFFLSLFLWWCLWPCLWWWPPLVGALPEPGAEVGS